MTSKKAKSKHIPLGWLVEQDDLVAGADGSLNHDGSVDACISIVTSSNALHDFRVRLSGIGIDGDHFAAGVTVEDRDDCLGPDSERVTNELIFAKATRGSQVDVQIRAESSLVHCDS